MADIFCPICKRTNDSTAERCWYCQAELTVDTNPHADEETDWLADLRGDSSFEASDTSEPIEEIIEKDLESPEEVPDWLAKIRLREQEEKGGMAESQESEAIPSDPNMPEWLKDIKSGNSGKKQETTRDEISSEPEEPAPSLYQSVQQNSMIPESSEGSDDTAEWLNQLASWKPGSTEENAEIQEEKSQQPDFDFANESTSSLDKDFDFNQMFLDAEAPTVPVSSYDSPSHDLQVQSVAEEPEQQNYFEPDQAETPAEDSQEPDLFADLQKLAQSNEPELEKKEDEVDLYSSLMESTSAEPEFDFLASLQSSNEPTEPESTSVEGDSSHQAISEINKAGEDLTTSSEEQLKEVFQEDWQKELFPTEETQSMPDFASSPVSNFDKPLEEDVPIIPDFEQNVFPSSIEDEKEYVSPFSSSIGENQPLENQPAASDEPDFSMFQSLQPSDDENQPFLSDDLPDWLTSAASETPTRSTSERITEQIEPGALEGSLEKTELPAWLQAIRPIDSAAARVVSASNSYQTTEEEGILAGIEGMLQSANISESISKPASYGSSLKVSERQKTHANLLAEMMEEKKKEQEVELTEKLKKKNNLLRVIIGILLIGMVFVSGSMLQQYSIIPVLFPQETVNAYDTINSLPADKPVLVALDFDAALSGEILWGSQTMLQHLMSRDIKLALVSSSPVGSALFSEELVKVNQIVPTYTLADNIINFGYLPGGTTGIQLMSTDIRSALPSTQEYYSAWDSTFLANVNRLQDFATVIVVTDKAENARAWVEQLNFAADAPPLLLVVSAQAAPLVQPYYQSGQVKGLISGFLGSMAYEQIIQQPGASVMHFTSYQFVLILVVIMIILGGMISLIRPRTERKG